MNAELFNFPSRNSVTENIATLIQSRASVHKFELLYFLIQIKFFSKSGWRRQIFSFPWVLKAAFTWNILTGGNQTYRPGKKKIPP